MSSYSIHFKYSHEIGTVAILGKEQFTQLFYLKIQHLLI